MSGRPWPEGVAELRRCAVIVRECDLEADRLRGIIAEANAAIKTAEYARSVAAKRSCELLTKMDCQPGGNFGSEARLVWLLAELVTPSPPQPA